MKELLKESDNVNEGIQKKAWSKVKFSLLCLAFGSLLTYWYIFDSSISQYTSYIFLGIPVSSIIGVLIAVALVIGVDGTLNDRVVSYTQKHGKKDGEVNKKSHWSIRTLSLFTVLSSLFGLYILSFFIVDAPDGEKFSEKIVQVEQLQSKKNELSFNRLEKLEGSEKRRVRSVSKEQDKNIESVIKKGSPRWQRDWNTSRSWMEGFKNKKGKRGDYVRSILKAEESKIALIQAEKDKTEEARRLNSMITETVSKDDSKTMIANGYATKLDWSNKISKSVSGGGFFLQFLFFFIFYHSHQVLLNNRRENGVLHVIKPNPIMEALSLGASSVVELISGAIMWCSLSLKVWATSASNKMLLQEAAITANVNETKNAAIQVAEAKQSYKEAVEDAKERIGEIQGRQRKDKDSKPKSSPTVDYSLYTDYKPVYEKGIPHIIYRGTNRDLKWFKHNYASYCSKPNTDNNKTIRSIMKKCISLLESKEA